MREWQPVIPIDYDTQHIHATIEDFGQVVDAIESGRFTPASVSRLKKVEARGRTFATRVCRNCDARFSCRSYYEYVSSTSRSSARELREFYNDFGLPDETEARLDAALPEMPPVKQWLKNV